MEFLAKLFELIVDFMKLEIDIYGFTISMWGIFIFTSVCDLVLYVIWRILDD